MLDRTVLPVDHVSRICGALVPQDWILGWIGTVIPERNSHGGLLARRSFDIRYLSGCLGIRRLLLAINKGINNAVDAIHVLSQDSAQLRDAYFRMIIRYGLISFKWNALSLYWYLEQPPPQYGVLPYSSVFFDGTSRFGIPASVSSSSANRRSPEWLSW